MLTGIHDALLIHNPAAGRSRHHHRARDLESARRILAEAGIRAEQLDTSGPGQAVELAREAGSQGRGMVIACGGDGTINEIANGLAGSQVPMAVLPTGTANVLGKELGLSWKIPEALRQNLAGRLERIALGLARRESPGARERYFVCVGGAGVDGSMVHQVDPQLKDQTGELAYWLTGISHFFTYPFRAFPVMAGDQCFQAVQVIVGRTKYYAGPFRVTTGADLFSDRFEVAVFTSTNRFRYPLHMGEAWSERLQEQSDVHFIKTDRVRCDAPPGATVYAEIDGEPAGQLPIEFALAPGALTLVVPQSETQKRPAGVD
ncbi:MAG TPA: diacylglycerol kinase family protein [Patescibacteria group bacterium]|nr:diacylglycerol kinase family protein [Patescibacteria group bacterium]